MDEYITIVSGVFDINLCRDFALMSNVAVIDFTETKMTRYIKLNIICGIPRFWKYVAPGKLWAKRTENMLKHAFMFSGEISRNGSAEISTHGFFAHVFRQFTSGVLRCTMYKSRYDQDGHLDVADQGSQSGRVLWVFTVFGDKYLFPYRIFELFGTPENMLPKLKALGFKRNKKGDYHFLRGNRESD